MHIIDVQAQAAAKGVYETPKNDSTGGVPPNHKQYKVSQSFLARESAFYVKRGGRNSNRNFRVFVGLSNDEDKVSALR